MKILLLIISFFVLASNVFSAELEDTRIQDLERENLIQKVRIKNMDKQLDGLKIYQMSSENEKKDLLKTNSGLLDNIDILRKALIISDDKKKEIEQEISEISSKEYTISEQMTKLWTSIMDVFEKGPNLPENSGIILFLYYILFCLLLTAFQVLITLPIRIVFKILSLLRGGSKKSESEQKYFKLYKEQLVKNNNINKDKRDLEREITTYKRQNNQGKSKITFGRQTTDTKPINDLKKEKGQNKEEVFTITTNDSDYYEKQSYQNSFGTSEIIVDKPTELTDSLVSNVKDTFNFNEVDIFDKKKADTKITEKKKKSFSLYSKSDNKSSIFD